MIKKKQSGGIEFRTSSADKLSPSELIATLRKIINSNIKLSMMIWGPPGIGKSSIVASVAKDFELALVDLRLSQLAPTDLRGLPVAKNGLSHWYPPEFLPREGKGILFLDEINMAPPTMQGIAQQLILDRKVGGYIVPDGWFVWAAGNRLEDHASVFEMPAPLANRFIHLNLEADFDSFKNYALSAGLHESIIAFLAFRPDLLHRIDESRSAWPSPRSWFMASQLHSSDISIQSAVGEPAAEEFRAYLTIYKDIPDLDAICSGSINFKFPEEPSTRYAVLIGLIVRAKDNVSITHALLWVMQEAPSEWRSAFVVDMLQQARKAGTVGIFTKIIKENDKLRQNLSEFREMLFQ